MSLIKTVRQYRLLCIRIASFTFNPGVLSTLLTIALLYLMISLGFWQAGRADFKNNLQQTIEGRKIMSPSTLDELPETFDQRRYLPVTFNGRYDRQHSFLLDNIISNGRVGYHVFTPVMVDETTAVLVARGFIDIGRSREQLPELATPDEMVKFSGLLDFSPPRTILLAENVQQTDKWPAVLQYVDLSEISQLLGYELYDMIMWLDEEEAGSLKYDLPVLNLNSAKNSGYAFQWFALSLALFIIYIVVNTKRINER